MIDLFASDRQFDLPLDDTAASRLLPWLIAAFIGLATIAFGIAAAADNALGALEGRARLVTVTIPAAADPETTQRDLEAALDLLAATPGVVAATPLAPEELQALIEPWLDEDTPANELPLPRLIDLTFDPTARLELADLQERLREVVPRATLGIEAAARTRGERLAVFVRGWGIALGGLALVALLAAVAWITRLSLDMHARTVELLKVMGADDAYIVRQFERHILQHVLRSGPLGFAIGGLAVVLLIGSGERMEIAGAADLGLRAVDWVLLVCVPAIAMLLTIAIARFVAAWGLERTP